MKKRDLIFITCLIIFFLPFFLSEQVFDFYTSFNKAHGMIMSFIKFAVLATIGEVIGLRISEGVYNKKGFGLIPRAIVWGFLGLTIKFAFVIFSVGAPIFLQYLGVDGVEQAMKQSFTLTKLLGAFTISASLNLAYAPVMMTLHKVMDTHILNNNGSLSGFFTPIKFGKIMTTLDWETQWNFIFKKTIPFFWIPAQTITFLLPEEYQILFAAFLGIILGVILAFANMKKNKN
ncbi:MAG: hypothetical protein DRJ01_09015 [Bacteroidetes bacterium]|nr:MAG: hypothetical protein DRJ01_09015 [Bacteroidota bacterium]